MNIDFLKDPCVSVRETAAFLLSNPLSEGKLTEVILPALSGALEDKEGRVRRIVIYSIERGGVWAEKALAKLKNNDPDRFVREGCR